MVNALNKQRPTLCTKNIKFHHDNAKPHVAKSVITYLESQKFKQRLDDHLKAESLASQIIEIVETTPHQEYIKTFYKWLERMRLCVENKGDFFEHFKNKI